ncbi:hypothetical protein ACI2L1_23235 [Streptomyces sp. NPDC019531]|uniref:hypothetical protein n=1 Tax=Streptomyces sp. NPDC019531 TaxID=3365062 RepID=UPI00384C93EB
MGTGHLERLQHIRALLTARGTATDVTRPHCYSATGFTHELRHLAENDPHHAAANFVIRRRLGRPRG